MKQILSILLISSLLFACGKSNMSPKISGLSGKYVSYRYVDTVYRGVNFTNGINEITIEMITGDTIITNPGLSNALIKPGAVPNFNPSSVTTDTLNFTSSTAGLESYIALSLSSAPFTYSLQAGTFNEGYVDPSFTVNKLIRINSTTIEVLSYQQAVTFSEKAATYFRKQ